MNSKTLYMEPYLRETASLTIENELSNYTEIERSCNKDTCAHWIYLTFTAKPS